MVEIKFIGFIAEKMGAQGVNDFFKATDEIKRYA